VRYYPSLYLERLRTIRKPTRRVGLRAGVLTGHSHIANQKCPLLFPDLTITLMCLKKKILSKLLDVMDPG
jgi:hypothetical protein